MGRQGLGLRIAVWSALALGWWPGQAAAQCGAAGFDFACFKTSATATRPLRFFVDGTKANPGGVQLSFAERAALSAWATWSDAGAAPRAVYAGLTTNNANVQLGSTVDVYNVTPTWIVTTADPLYGAVGLRPLVTAVTIPVHFRGVLQTCDVFVNGADHPLSTLDVVPTGAVDIESVLVHEFGHCLGLEHHPGAPLGQVMSVGANPPGYQTIRRALGAEDVAAVRYRYPAADDVGAPCRAVDGGCGAGALRCLTPPEDAAPAVRARACGRIRRGRRSGSPARRTRTPAAIRSTATA